MWCHLLFLLLMHHDTHCCSTNFPRKYLSLFRIFPSCPSVSIYMPFLLICCRLQLSYFSPSLASIFEIVIYCRGYQPNHCLTSSPNFSTTENTTWLIVMYSFVVMWCCYCYWLMVHLILCCDQKKYNIWCNVSTYISWNCPWRWNRGDDVSVHD